MRNQALYLIIPFLLAANISQAKIANFQTTVRAKADVLFVVDNSGTMAAFMNSVNASVPKFLEVLQKNNIDYHIGVTTTDAYLNAYYPNASKLRLLRDGEGPLHSGVFVVTPETAVPSRVLAINLKQGTAGSGDERAFSSFRDVLSDPANAPFRRADASLSVVVISDEDDFSHNDLSDDPANLLKNYYFTEKYDDPKMYSIIEFANYLKGIGGQHSSTLSSISVQDSTCLAKSQGAKISRRYNELSEISGGVSLSICDVDASMTKYAEFVVSTAVLPPTHEYVIKLDRMPIAQTIVVKVNGRFIPANEADGWSFDAETLSLTLHGKSVPAKGDIVSVTYDYQE